ncbi:MAG: response regulator transcription factor [Solirubrobacteraceae bacterium]
MTSTPIATTPVRVLVVDDQTPFRAAARALVEATAGFEWIGGASSGEEGVMAAERLHPDLVLMDVRMPGIGGFGAAQEMARRGLATRIVLVTADEPAADPAAAPSGSAPEVVSKRRLNHAVLARLWEDRR